MKTNNAIYTISENRANEILNGLKSFHISRQLTGTKLKKLFFYVCGKNTNRISMYANVKFTKNNRITIKELYCIDKEINLSNLIENRAIPCNLYFLTEQEKKSFNTVMNWGYSQKITCKGGI
jgi:hypothetical protein